MNRSLRRALYAAPLGLVMSLTALAPTRAYAADPAGAQALFTEGKRLMTDGHYADACPKLEESQRLDPGMGTLFQLATCHQHVGKTATAWAEYLDVAAQAKALGQKDREKVAREKATSLESQVSKVVIATRIRGADSVPGLEIKRDGVDVGRGQWGVALPMDPGDHKIVATAPGKKRWETTTRVGSDGKTTTVDIPVLEDAPRAVAVTPPPPTTVTPSTGGVPASTTAQGSTTVASTETTTRGPVDEDTNRGSGQRIAGLVILGVGVAGIATGAVVGLQSKSKHDDSNAHCNGNICDATGVQLRDDARTSGNISTIAFGAGAAAVVGGLVLFFTAPSSPSGPITTTTTARRIDATPLFGNGTTGLSIRGSF
jgi:hypothetical protein